MSNETKVAGHVHNHGTEEGLGLACPERRLPSGSLRGQCLHPARDDFALIVTGYAAGKIDGRQALTGVLNEHDKHLAAHEAALREQIAQQIEAMHVGDYSWGLVSKEDAAAIVRGES